MRSRFWYRVALSTFAAAGLVVAGCGDDPTPPPSESPAQVEEPAPPAPMPQAAVPGGAPASEAPARRREPLLVPGAPLPEDFPRDLPVPASSEQTAAFDGGPEHTAVIYESTADLGSVFSDLQARIPSTGWQVSIADQNGAQSIIMASKGPRSVVVVMSAGEGGKTLIEITAIGSN